MKLAEEDWKRAYSDDPTHFTTIPIDPAILEEERQFQIQQIPLNQIELDSEDEGDGSGSGGRSDITGSPPRSVASIDSIAENADFISFE